MGLKDMIGKGCVREGLMSYEAIRKSGLLERQGLMERYDHVFC